MKTKLFLLLTVLSVLSTQAQNLTIKGRVTDTSQEAIIAANVSLWTTDSTLVTGVTSDTQGKFALNKIKAVITAWPLLLSAIKVKSSY